jgi:hypothetical protein
MEKKDHILQAIPELFVDLQAQTSIDEIFYVLFGYTRQCFYMEEEVYTAPFHHFLADYLKPLGQALAATIKLSKVSRLTCSYCCRETFG